MMPLAPRVHRFAGVLVPVLVGMALIAQASWFQQTTSAVWDEVIYLTAGLDFYHHGHIDRLVTLGIAPLPVMLFYLAPALAFSADQLAPVELSRAVALARVANLVGVGLPLVLLPYFWMARRRGLLAGSVVGVLLACSPMVLTFSGLAVTDGCFALAFLCAVAAIDAYLRRPTAKRFVTVGLVCGVALAAKYTAILLFPMALVAFVWSGRLSAANGGTVKWLHVAARAAVKTVTVAAIAIVFVWTLHGFALDHVLPDGWTSPPSLRGPVGNAIGAVGRTLVVPAPVRSIVFQLQHAGGGQPQFLLGQKSTHGWWYYFPVALLLKSTPAELLMAALLPFLLWWSRTRMDTTSVVLALTAAFVLLSVLPSQLDIGVRYVLVLYPLTVLLTVDLAAVIGQQRRWLPWLLGLIAVVQIASAVGAAPQYLSYFNGLFTPPGTAYTRLVDSNLDWGQDLPALRTALAERGTSRVLLAYFGAAPPEAYGVQATPWDSPDDRDVAGHRWVAVSATLLNGVYLRGDPFQGFRRLDPDARLSEGMFLYDVSKPGVQRAVAFMRSRVALQPCRAGATAPKPGDPSAGALSHWHIRCNGFK